MSAVQPIYTWSTPQGTLDLLPIKKGHAFCLTTKSQTQVRIPATRSHDCLFVEAQNVAAVCEYYFPTLNQNPRNQWIITFDLSATFDMEMPIQQNKGMGAFNFSFNSLENKKQIKVSKTAPAYRRVISGLNMEGECTNTKCEAIGKSVLIKKGMGSFNIAQLKHTSSCPACDAKIPFDKMNNLGFWNCNFEIEGQKENQVDGFSKKEAADKEHYTTYVPGEECAWEYIQITTTPLQVAVEEAPLSTPANRGCAIL